MTAAPSPPRFVYPPAHRTDVVDDYHGNPVPDPYRWLEDPESDETREFVQAQNAVTRPYLDSLTGRPAIRERIAELWDIPRTAAPESRGGVTVWSHNDGVRDQPVWHVRRHGAADDEVLLDPNRISEDGAVAVITGSLSPDGALWAYSLAEAGSDWQVIRLRDTASAADLPDELHHVKFTSIAWHGDGFFYSRFPAQEPGSTAPSRNMSVHFHRLGTSQDDDVEVFRNLEDPDPGYDPTVSHDGRFLVLTEWVGTSVRYGILYRNLMDPDPEWIRLVPAGVARHSFLAHVDGAFLVHTDLDAPRGRIVRIPLDRPREREQVVAESASPVEQAVAVAGRLALVRLHEASHRIDLHLLDGCPAGVVELPSLGTVAELTGKLDDNHMFVGFESFLHPPTALRWTESGTEVFAGAAPPIDPDEIVVERHSARSADGTDVGMFVMRRRDGAFPAPVELYGYGGFNISLTPSFNPARLAFVEAGGVVAVANLRGGGEHGEGWHEAGMLGDKQRVFDDLIACAEHLVGDGTTTPAGLGIRGGSNGGLLVAAAMLRRPDLFGAVVCQVPVADMLRYQHFTAGRYWTVEYGDAGRDPDAFAWLIAYSPYHTVRSGVTLPPLLITTAETDDRVVPMHALKLAAAVQHAAGGRSDHPLLVRIETRAGHGLGKPTSKLIDEMADIYGFLLHHLRP